MRKPAEALNGLMRQRLMQKFFFPCYRNFRLRMLQLKLQFLSKEFNLHLITVLKYGMDNAIE